MLYNNQYHKNDLSDTSFLITGGSGFIGSNIVEYLLKYGAKKVRALGVKHSLASTSKGQELLSYKSLFNLQSGVEISLEYYKNLLV